MLGFSAEKSPGGYSPLKMTAPLYWSTSDQTKGISTLLNPDPAPAQIKPR